MSYNIILDWAKVHPN